LSKGHRKINRGEPCDCGPVCLTRVLFKVVGRSVKDNIAEHLNECDIIRGSERGFIRGLSRFTNP